MKESKPQPRDQIEHHDRQNNRSQHGRHNRRDPFRREVEGRIDGWSMSQRMTTMRRGMEIASNTFRDDRDQAKLQIGSPVEWPEEKLPGALNGGRNGIHGRDGAHMRPFRVRHSVAQNYADITWKVPQPVAASHPTTHRRPPAPARTATGAAPSYPEPSCAALLPVAPAGRR